MNSYELHLLGLVYAATGGVLDLDRRPGDGAYYADGTFEDDGPAAYPTLAEALAALLTDLGVEVPERPTKEWAGGAAMGMVETYINAIEAQDKGTWTAEAPIEAIFSYLTDLYAREPLTVLALLEGGAS